MQKPFKSGDLVFMMKSLLLDIAPVNIEPQTPGAVLQSSGLVT